MVAKTKKNPKPERDTQEGSSGPPIVQNPRYHGAGMSDVVRALVNPETRKRLKRGRLHSTPEKATFVPIAID